MADREHDAETKLREACLATLYEHGACEDHYGKHGIHNKILICLEAGITYFRIKRIIESAKEEYQSSRRLP